MCTATLDIYRRELPTTSGSDITPVALSLKAVVDNVSKFRGNFFNLGYFPPYSVVHYAVVLPDWDEPNKSIRTKNAISTKSQ